MLIIVGFIVVIVSVLGGYVLSHVDAWGPLFLAGGADQTVMDGNGETIETADSDWALWGVVYVDRDQQVDTKWGKRVDSTHRVLLLFGNDSVAYRQASDSAPPATAKPTQQEPAKKQP